VRGGTLHRMALKQTSIWLDEEAVRELKRIGKRPEVDREWSYLVRKAIDEYIQRDHEQAGKRKAATN
jgi:predicted transcriptional regulator